MISGRKKININKIVRKWTALPNILFPKTQSCQISYRLGHLIHQRNFTQLGLFQNWVLGSTSYDSESCVFVWISKYLKLYYFHKVPVILHRKLEHDSYKLLPQSRDCRWYLCRQLLTIAASANSVSRKKNDISTHDFAYSAD